MEVDSEYYDTYHSPIGKLLISATDKGVRKIEFAEDSTMSLMSQIPNAYTLMANEWLDEYFHGREALDLELQLDIKGTIFQHKVWQLIKSIPHGDMVTYQQISAMIPGSSARAVGTATGANPVAIYIPCHRVVGKGTLLRGYAGGIKRKEWLLAYERKDSLFLPDV